MGPAPMAVYKRADLYHNIAFYMIVTGLRGVLC